MTTLRIQPIYWKKSDYAGLDNISKEIYDTIARYVNGHNKFGHSFDMQDIEEGEFIVTIEWRSKYET